MARKNVWTCQVRLVAREWKQEVHSEDALEPSLLSTFGRIDLVARAAEQNQVDVKRIEYVSGPVYQAAQDDTSAYYSYRYLVFANDGTRAEWELRCSRTVADE